MMIIKIQSTFFASTKAKGVIGNFLKTDERIKYVNIYCLLHELQKECEGER